MSGNVEDRDLDYLNFLLTEGSKVPVDVENSYILKVPKWIHHEKVRRGQLFFLLNINSIMYGVFCGLLASFALPSVLKVLLYTNRSTTPQNAYMRFKRNMMHIHAWYQYELKPETKAWKSIQDVRRIHYTVSNNSEAGGAGIISQKDMVLTQLAFMGFAVTRFRFLGVRGNYEQFDAFCHLWRVLGHLLGIEERFNLCAETLEETIARIELLTEEILAPALNDAGSDFEKYTRSAFQGIWCFNPEVHYESTLYFTKRLAGVPGYHYFQYEIEKGDTTSNKENLSKLSLYARLRLFLTVIVYQYSTKYFIVRWALNIIQIFVTKLLEVIPIIAIFKFGKKCAYVKIVE